MKKKVRIAIVDFSVKERVLVERLLGFVTDRYDFDVTEDDPDFILHSCMGVNALKFNGVRIFYTEENFSPDFNLSDYALAMDRMTFGDRYHRLPLYRLYSDTYATLHGPRIFPEKRRERFCTCVVSNARREGVFLDLFHALEKYKPVASGGRLLNNVGGRVPDKKEFTQSGRFGLAIENSVAPGYITEKLTDIYAAGAIPIYYGDPQVAEDFNPASFVNLAEYVSLEEAVQDIIAIDQDETRYAAMLNAPVFMNGREPVFLKESVIKEFLYSIFDQPREKAYRRNRMIRGQLYIKKLRTAFFKPHVQVSRLLRGWFRKKGNRKTYVPPLSITSDGAVYSLKI